MAEKSRSDVIRAIENHIAGNGGSPAEWYVAITDAPRQALFTVHKVKSSGDAWISRKAAGEQQAAEVAEYFQTVLNTKGSQKDPSPGQVFVYAYRTKPHTSP